MQDQNRIRVTLAEIDGEILYYDACSASPDAYDEAVFKYIGKGQIYTINGVRQSKSYDRYFYVKVKPCKPS